MSEPSLHLASPSGEAETRSPDRARVRGLRGDARKAPHPEGFALSTSPEGEARARRRRAFRTAGLVACLLGVIVMLTGRFVAAAPVWLIWPGLAIIALGWVLLAAAAVRRPKV